MKWQLRSRPLLEFGLKNKRSKHSNRCGCLGFVMAVVQLDMHSIPEAFRKPLDYFDFTMPVVVPVSEMPRKPTAIAGAIVCTVNVGGLRIIAELLRRHNGYAEYERLPDS